MNLKQQALALYRIAFPEDSDAFSEDFIERFFDGNCLTLQQEGRLASMLFLFDCNLTDDLTAEPVRYVYAVATHPDFRGRGLMRRLMEQAGEKAACEGAKALIIKPSDEGLYGFYEKLGFQTACFYREFFYAKAGEQPADIQRIDSLAYHRTRERLLKATPHIGWASMMDYITERSVLLRGDRFCACAEKQGGELFVREFLSEDGTGKDAVLAYFSADCATFRTPGGDRRFGMLRPLDNALTIIQKPLYMGFAMD